MKLFTAMRRIFAKLKSRKFVGLLFQYLKFLVRYSFARRGDTFSKGVTSFTLYICASMGFSNETSQVCIPAPVKSLQLIEY
jgi:hypothetical protein